KMKNFNIKTFGMLAEKLSASEFKFLYCENSEALRKALEDEYPQLKSLNFSIAVDKQVIQEKTSLNGNEEIALLPPFSGG
ncbi:MAG TPA: MoaD/ThiS family protein, partial [Salinimicrobium sp.]|nr:MoaD/ThiS family protein [Salinimicrobium sp.]